MDGSDNPTGAGNQQGRPRGLTPGYVAGFVDGEGCFNVSIRPHPTVRYGSRCVIGHVFQIYQHRDDVELLRQFKEFFDCGHITSKGPNSNVMTYAVSGRRDLVEKVIPFFEKYTLLSSKAEDFSKFRAIVLAMNRKEHLTKDGFRKIVELAFTMNKRGKQRKYTIEQILDEPSETVRRALQAHAMSERDETVRPLWRHREGDRNDHPATQLKFLSGGNRRA